MHIFRQRAFETKGHAADRMDEREQAGMESLSPELCRQLPQQGMLSWSPVDRIAEKWEASLGKMNAHLMCPTRFQPGFDERRVPEGVEQAILRYRGSSLTDTSGKAFAIARMSAVQGLNSARGRIGRTADDRPIPSLNRMGLKLGGETMMGSVGLTGDHHTARQLVESVHDAWTENATHTGEMLGVRQ